MPMCNPWLHKDDIEVVDQSAIANKFKSMISIV